MYDDNEEMLNETSVQKHESGPTPSSYDDVNPKKTKTKRGLMFAALTLTVALLGGAAGGSLTGYLIQENKVANEASSSVSSASNDTSVKYATSLSSSSTNTINSIYESYKTSVVGVKNEGTSTNVFGQSSPTASVGSGFIISADGYILTNNHVVDGAEKVTVTLYDEKDYEATVVGADADSDVALLKINANGLNPVKLGDSGNILVGETIFAIGNPLGELTYTVTAGIVSAENREINENGIPISMFQTDVAINPGNSGGPVFNLNGEVVGIATAKYASATIEGIGFAIPINDAVSVAEQLKETGKVSGRPYLGVSVKDVNSLSDNTTGLSEGVYVASVDPNGGSAPAGIKVGDVITAIDNSPISSMTDLVSILKNYEAGTNVKVRVYRDGETITLTVTLSANKPNV